jgi:hypothetical protein
LILHRVAAPKQCKLQTEQKPETLGKRCATSDDL